MTTVAIPGYRLGDTALPRSPRTAQDLAVLKTCLEVEAMHAAWTKAVLLQTMLWCRPYVKDGDF